MGYELLRRGVAGSGLGHLLACWRVLLRFPGWPVPLATLDLLRRDRHQGAALPSNRRTPSWILYWPFLVYDAHEFGGEVDDLTNS